MQRDDPAATALPAVSVGPRAFFRAPQSVAEALAAMLDPAVIVLMLAGLHAWHGVPFGRWATALALMVVALTFPGRHRLDSDSPAALARGILLHWSGLVTILALCAYVTRSLGDIDAALAAQWVLLTPLAHWLAAMALRALIRWRAARESGRRTAVIVGGGALSVATAQALARREHAPVRVVGVFDDRGDDRIADWARGMHRGRLDQVARYVAKLGIREVYITLPIGAERRVTDLLDHLQRTTASLYYVPDVMGHHVVQGRLQDLHGLPMVGICETPFTGINAVVKRASDIVIALSALVLTAPLLLLAMLAIRLESPGPAVVVHRLMGLDGEEIVVHGLRTARMRDGSSRSSLARDADGPPTRLGRNLRRWSLDRLPRLVDVLTGRLSLVGPRPFAVAQSAAFGRQVRGYMVRHKARPGVTGWAQVTGLADDDSLANIERRVQCDLDYLRNWSLGLDLRILARTLVFIGQRARDAR